MNERGDWMSRAGCRGKTDLFFPDGPGYLTLNAVREAKRICNACSVKVECRAELRSMPPAWQQHGVWAGETPSERDVDVPDFRPGEVDGCVG